MIFRFHVYDAIKPQVLRKLVYNGADKMPDFLKSMVVCDSYWHTQVHIRLLCSEALRISGMIH